ncbi:hypothetical protein NYF14_16565 [Sphingobium sp. 10 DY56-G10]|uniref:hypothetical protein n=1 Tax=Sphingomonadales TaxID=204457 RepID=UPI0000D7B199|nr:hypothetical protein [Sphingomonas sp. SKA58]EAT07524.1 hypothetical protein SKA58_02949 [Sphingomonas sp. SKA58]|tara:strand:+ start:238 stop:1032 length:795 start_codon:yes stop_codon:yes gene_type:complete
MVDPFISPRQLFAWADHNFINIKRRLKSFDEERPYTYIVEQDAETGEYIHKVRLLKSIPPEISLLTFDVVNALRASLDQSIFASGVVLLGREPNGTKFPFGADETEARKDAYRKRSEADPEIIDRVLSFQPYNAGDRLLFNLNKLRNMKHHRIIAPVLVQTGSIKVTGGTFVSDGPFAAMSMNNAVEWDASKNELTLFRTGTPKSQYEIEIGVRISFTDRTAFPNSDALTVLHDLFHKVQSVLVAIEEETVRLANARGIPITFD